MAKHNAPTTTATANSKKGGKGIPRVTTAVLAMDDAARKVWLDGLTDKDGKAITAEVRVIVEANIAKAVKKGSKDKKGEIVFNQEWAKSLSLMQLLSVKTVVDAEIPTRANEKKAQADAIKARMAADAAALAAMEA